MLRRVHHICLFPIAQARRDAGIVSFNNSNFSSFIFVSIAFLHRHVRHSGQHIWQAILASIGTIIRGVPPIGIGIAWAWAAFPFRYRIANRLPGEDYIISILLPLHSSSPGPGHPSAFTRFGRPGRHHFFTTSGPFRHFPGGPGHHCRISNLSAGIFRDPGFQPALFGQFAILFQRLPISHQSASIAITNNRLDSPVC